MEDDNIISLACSMHAKKGIYALLLGSGISRDAGIPTGWEIVNKLIEKIAGSELADPVSWYENKYEKTPNYSDIVEKLGRTPTERSSLLREYFEPRESDEENTKKPTKAHRAIARIIKKGYIKIVLTTNFDRLLEQALYDEGIIPEIIANTDQIEGAYPLVHSDCLIVKIHGDYMDARIRNTEEEVSNYPEALNTYIDRILDEFGLIICGWSGDWDRALIGCLERCKAHRFSTYWLHINEPTENAKALIFRRKAETIKINSANEFFCDLEEKIESLTDLSLRNQPLSIEMARSTLKRWIPETKNYIKIRDMITDEARFVMSVCDKKPEKKSPIEPVDIHFLEDSMKKLANFIVILCYYSKSSYENIVIDTLDILTKQNNKIDEWGKWDYYYPASIYICSVLLGCVRIENYNLLYKILNHKFKKRNNDSDIEPDEPISIHLYFHHAGKYRDIFYEYFKNPMKEFVADELHYDQLFDKAKSIFAMHFRDIKVYDPSIKLHSLYQNLKEIFSGDLKEGSKCTLLQSGFFGGDFERFRECMNHIKIENPFY